jgi:hypothetical protein
LPRSDSKPPFCRLSGELGGENPAKSSDTLTLRNFTLGEVAELYKQHTDATTQKFAEDVAERVFYWTDGQPWLVNAIAKQIIEKDLERDYSVTITSENVDNAVDILSKRMDTHLLSVFSRLEEKRVKNIIEPMLTGDTPLENILDMDGRYCVDIGLVKFNEQGLLAPANRIYSDLIIRYLTFTHQPEFPEYIINK